MRRVAFFLHADSSSWLGGLSYLRNLLTAVCFNKERSIEPVLFVHPSLDQGSLSGFPEVEIVRTTMAAPRHPLRVASRIIYRLIRRDLTLETFLTKHHVEAVSHSTTTGMRSRVVSIGWLPDFQHIRMPQHFSKSESRRRDKQFRRLINGSHRIILSSQDAVRDFSVFAPNAVHKARVLKFVSCPTNIVNSIPQDLLIQRFGIDRHYFHLPNQFWTHKNHAIVIEALSILKRSGVNLLVLATGNTVDYRNRLHFKRLIARAKQLGVEQSFRVLGIVTIPELQSLMLNAIALINPSDFEGWSTTVEESKSLGLPIILSDIPVHVEQAPPLGRYFKAGSADHLADALLASVREYDPLQAKCLQERAAADLPARIKQFGSVYDEIVTSSFAKMNSY